MFASFLSVFKKKSIVKMLQIVSRVLYGAAINNSLTRAVTTNLTIKTIVRNGSVFGSLPSDRLWEGVTGPEGQTKKRARGKRRVTRPKIDLNVGQEIGVGSQPMNWPGLTGPLDSKVKELESKENRSHLLFEYRNLRAKKRQRLRLPPLERGWSGGRRGGEVKPAPASEPGADLSNFETTVIEAKMVSIMTATKGRSGRFSVQVVLGNGEGVGGIAVGKSSKFMTAVNRASLKASHNLELFNLYDNRTLWHNAYKQSRSTKIFVKTMPEGYGLICHRVLKSICKSIGIKDMYAKVEGSVRNYQQIAKIFFNILREQESHQELADREHLHVVEQAMDRDNYPRVLASPTQGYTREKKADEDLDFRYYYYGGRVPNIKVNPKPGYLKGPGQMRKAKDRYRFRNQEKAFVERQVYEALRSGLQA